MMRIVTLLLLAMAAALSPATAAAQPTPGGPGGWDAARPLELIRRAQQRRAAASGDEGLTSYRSDARIYVYFYLDRTDTGDRNLVKTDQLALEVFWQAPDLTKQRIVGWRDLKSLPTNINYHLDHLTVVQENFGDEIRIGDGDEVMNVVHPAAPGAERFYQYRMADSLTLRLPGADEPVRVYEIQVRPRDPSSPGFLGSVFVDRRAGDIVRMDFTFTQSSYVDRYLDYINISLDNGLWQGRYWLPNQQRVEIRRRIPELDIPAGSVIRANMQVGNYRFDEPLPPAFFSGSPVIAVPRALRDTFPFEEEIHAQLRAEGIGPAVELGEIRRMASELVADHALNRDARARLQLGSASDALRYGRAEGLVLASGIAVTPVTGWRLSARGGWAFGAAHPLASVELSGQQSGLRLKTRVFVNEPRDMGIEPVSSGVLNSLSSLVAGEDYTDPYYAGGASVDVGRDLGDDWQIEVGLLAERQRSATLASDFSIFGDHRPVAPIDPTDLLVEGRTALLRRSSAEAGRWLDATLTADLGWMQPPGRSAAAQDGADPLYLRPQVALEWGRRGGRGDLELRLGGRAGVAFGELPQQRLFRLGGRGTMPGYDFRRYGGDRYVTIEGVASVDLAPPWVRGRLLAAAGWVGAGDAADAALGRGELEPAAHLLPGVGVGLGIFHDIVRVDLVRGVGPGGRWEVIVDANRAFWDFL